MNMCGRFSLPDVICVVLNSELYNFQSLVKPTRHEFMKYHVANVL
jgi:hypothetical protein